MRIRSVPMFHSLLALAAVWAQVISLCGPAFVLCIGRDGRVGVEYVGEACAGCPTPDAALHQDRCGCCHDEPDEVPPPGPSADAPCDCRHIPLADGDREPCALTQRTAVDHTPSCGTALPPSWPGLTSLEFVPGSRHDPPGDRPAPSAHLSHLAGVVLRC